MRTDPSKGTVACTCFGRDRGSRTDFLLMSLWESYDAIRKFAGPEYERAVYYPRDMEFLVEFEPSVVHYEVLLAPERAK